MINPMNFRKYQERLQLFTQEHPRVFPFLQDVAEHAIEPGSVIEMTVTTPAGRKYVSNIRVNEDDVETIRMAKDASGKN